MDEISKLKIENLRLHSMCRVAGELIKENYQVFCDKDGYGPDDLVSRLRGQIPPDFYGQGMDQEEIYEYLALIREQSN
jgi:hypothetical protein